MTEAEETIARLRIYLNSRIAEALEAARTAPEESIKWLWGHITSEELGAVLLVLDSAGAGRELGQGR